MMAGGEPGVWRGEGGGFYSGKVRGGNGWRVGWFYFLTITVLMVELGIMWV